MDAGFGEEAVDDAVDGVAVVGVEGFEGADAFGDVGVGGGDRTDYFNVYPPQRCRPVRVAGVTYSSSRTAVYAGDIELTDFQVAQKTFNGDRYAYPKLPHLDSAAAVDEAVELTKRAIKRTER